MMNFRTIGRFKQGGIKLHAVSVKSQSAESVNRRSLS